MPWLIVPPRILSNATFTCFKCGTYMLLLATCYSGTTVVSGETSMDVYYSGCTKARYVHTTMADTPAERQMMEIKSSVALG